MTLGELLRIPLTIVVESQEKDHEWVRIATIEQLPQLSVIGHDMEELVDRTERERFISLVDAVICLGWTPSGSGLRDINLENALTRAGLPELIPLLEQDVRLLPPDLLERIRSRLGAV